MDVATEDRQTQIRARGQQQRQEQGGYGMDGSGGETAESIARSGIIHSPSSGIRLTLRPIHLNSKAE